jgi:hypothetical protein
MVVSQKDTNVEIAKVFIFQILSIKKYSVSQDAIVVKKN